MNSCERQTDPGAFRQVFLIDCVFSPRHLCDVLCPISTPVAVALAPSPSSPTSATRTLISFVTFYADLLFLFLQ